MKKHYETPTVEKIQFDYREQVVAASGGNGGGEFGRMIFSDACNIQSLIALGYDVCSNLPF